MGDTPFDLNFPFAYGGPCTQADFRTHPDDFIVDEILSEPPSGEGEHLCLQLTKRGENTGWLAEQLAKAFGVRPVDIGYHGLKDRHACTTQWFSVHLPKPDPEQAQILANLPERLEAQVVLREVRRHNKKLRRGGHLANRFTITLRNLRSDDGVDARLKRIAAEGVPNYFGEQRFGNHGSNLMWADRWLSGGEAIRNRGKRIMAQSAARSWLFNQVLAARVRDDSWRHATFDESHPSGPLWGRGRPVATEPQREYEQVVIAPWSAWLDPLEHVGLNQERRALVLQPQDCHWQLDAERLVISFMLPPGGYATAVLRELCTLNNLSMPEAEQ
ncbi:tRNA pseudouridine(13) synthase TruD [Teredinibacter turnerae]|uniref:tRNA pseudouridine(13) synthase TruD n=1 Tax=Teredinibacter turnerae TaxID=2426 RepID=UPI00035D8DA1|nr:tRNA pseudouridine(13) synthase TruD [Teredinibacter turnerae]